MKREGHEFDPHTDNSFFLGGGGGGGGVAGGGLYATRSFCGGSFWRCGFDKPCAYVLNTGTEKQAKEKESRKKRCIQGEFSRDRYD